MNPIRINRQALSEFVWLQLPYKLPDISQLSDELEGLRAQADYNTGSIGFSEVHDLQSIVSHFQPVTVAEVGTFIGRSTAAIASCMPKGGVIYTCDVSNAVTLPELNTNVEVKQYRRTNSATMFADLANEQKTTIDLFYIDGRLQLCDIGLMKDLMRPNTVIVLDDFEGIEKGVTNAMLLLQHLGAGYLLIYPRKQGSKTAMILPSGLLMFTAQ